MSPARSAFVGRLQELAEIAGGIEEVARGRGALFLLTGEPGIGKTRLAEEASSSTQRAGSSVLWGRCHEAEGSPPYWPWAQVVAAYARQGNAAAVAAALSADAAPIAHLVPELRPHLEAAPAPAATSTDSETARFRLFQALTAMLRDAAAAQPVVIVLDDIHWADLPSLRMLEFLAHELPETRIVVIATFRDVEARRTPIVADIVSRLGRRGRRMDLSGLTVEEVSSFVRDAAGQVTPAVVEQLHRQTEGNPFFLDEVVRLYLGRGAWFADGKAGLPASRGVRGAIRQRLEPLTERTRRLLSAAAVAGREFELALLALAVGLPRSAVLAELTAALDLEIVASVPSRPGCYRFSHALVRETVYEDLAPATRADLHRRFGMALEERQHLMPEPPLAELAHHFSEAAAGGGEDKAIEVLQRAGHQALGLLAYEQAAEHFARALQLSELDAARQPVRDCELLLGLAEARNRAGQADESVRVAHRAALLARSVGSPALLARAAIALCDVGAAWTELGRSDETLVRILEEALETLAPADTALRARVMARLATELFWGRPAEESEKLSAEAVALARQADDRHSLAYTLLARLHCVSDPDMHVQRKLLIEEVLALTDGRGELAANAYLWKFGDELQFGEMLEVERSRRRMIAAVEGLRQPGDAWLIAAIESQQALLEGHFEEAEGYAARMLENPTQKYNAEQASLALLFLVRRDQGRQAELTGGLAVAAAESPVAVWRTSLALLHAESGQPDAARQHLDALIRDDLSAICRDLCWLYSVASLAQTCAICGDPSQHRVLYEALLPYDGRNAIAGVFYYLGPVSYYLGILAAGMGRHEQAAAHLQDALQSARALGARPYVARILLALATLAAAWPAAHSASSGALGRGAEKMARELGMQSLAAEAAALAAASDEGGAGAVSLTASRSEGAGDGVRHATLRCEGDHWVLGYGSRTARLKDARGLHHLARLLGEPGREFHVLDMAGSHELIANGAGLGPMLDGQARTEISRRLSELRFECDEAERNNDAYRGERARQEIETITETLAGAIGLGGRDRTGTSASERARAAVTKAIRTTIQRIHASDPVIGDILSRTISTGVYCSYVPITELPIAWDLGVRS